MAEHSQNTPEELVRSQTFDGTGPLELDVELTTGRLEVQLGDGPVTAEIRHDPSAGEPRAEAVTNILSWVGEHLGQFGSQFGQFGNQFGTPYGGRAGADPARAATDAVTQCRLEQVGNRVVVAAPRSMPLRSVPLAITVHAPAGSHLTVKAGAADVTVTGTAGRADIVTGSGRLHLDEAEDAATLRTGSGGITTGPLRSGVQLRSGSGTVEIAALGAQATVGTGSGAVRLGEVTGSVLVRTSSGDVSVTDAGAGELETVTGSGAVRVALRRGVAAEIELSSGSGTVSSELDITTSPPSGEVPLSVRARTGSGDAVVTRAAS